MGLARIFGYGMRFCSSVGIQDSEGGMGMGMNVWGVRLVRRVVGGLLVALVLVLVGQPSVALGQLRNGANGVRTPPVVVVQQAMPNTSVAPGGVVTYEMFVKNQSGDSIGNVTVSLMYYAETAEVVDTVFVNQPGATVVAGTGAGLLQFETGHLERDAVLKVVVNMRVVPGAVVGAPMTHHLTYSWYDGGQYRTERSNGVPVVVASGQVHQEVFRLRVTPGFEGEPTLTLFESAAIFGPFEPVQLWYNTSSGEVREVGIVNADLQGRLVAEYDQRYLFPGSYSMVARGLWTDFTAIGPFTVDQRAP